MTPMIKHGLLAVVIATAIGAGSVVAQVQTKTVQVGSNCTVTVTTSVLTNGGAMAVGGTCTALNPQVIIKTLGGNGGGMDISGGTLDPQAIVQIISGAMGGNSPSAAPDPQALLKALTGSGVVTPAALMDTNPVTWLGLAADELSEDVRAQLPLPEGAGLLVRHITANGPAAQAGVLKNDILIKLDDQLLVNAAQLRALVHGKNDGEKIALSLLRKGKELKVTAKLVSKVLPPDEAGRPQTITLGPIGQLGGGPIVFQKNFTTGNGTNLAATINIQAIMEAVSNAMQQAQQQLNAPAK